MNVERLIGQGRRTLGEAKLLIDACQHREQLSLHRRLARQVTLHSLGAFIEHLPQGDVPPGSLRGIGALKDADQERLHRLGLLRLERLRTRLPGGRCKPANERDDQRHRYRDADAMPPHEFASAISPSLRPCRHRPALEKPLQILGERTCADIAALRFPAKRFQHDRIEVARQARGQRARGHAPRVRDLVDRCGVITILGTTTSDGRGGSTSRTHRRVRRWRTRTASVP